MKKKVLILYFTQFGYHIDSFMYAKYGDKKKLDLHYFCFDKGLEKLTIEGVTIKYIRLYPSRIRSFINYFTELKKYLLREKFDLIFHIDGKFTPVIRIINLFVPMVLDIRSGNLSNNRLKLWFGNKRITYSSMLYRHISVIAKSLSEELKLDPVKTTIIPLGGELHRFPPKDFKSIRLLYVGSLNNRNIEQTVTGLSLFRSTHRALEITYDIIGFGNEITEEKLKETIIKAGMSDSVCFHGRKPHPELNLFFEKCNIGVVFIPMKRYYDFQPSTKFYEFLLSGMPVIATNTLENRLSLKENYGILCEDNPRSFSEALKQLYNGRERFDSERIKDAYVDFQWRNIVRNIWEPFIMKAIN